MNSFSDHRAMRFALYNLISNKETRSQGQETSDQLPETRNP